MGKKKLLILMDYFRVPGWEYYLGNALIRQGIFDVHFIIGELRNKQNLKILPQITVVPPFGGVRDIFFFPPGEMIHQIKAVDPDYTIIVNLKNIQTTFMGFLKDRLRTKLILKEHMPTVTLKQIAKNFWVMPWFFTWTRLQGQLIKNKLDAVIAITPNQAEFFRRNCRTGAPLSIIPSGVETKLFYPDQNIEKKKAILYLGRFVENKLSHYLQVIPSIATRFPNWRFTFAGEGPWLGKILSVQKQLGDRIKVSRYLDHQGLPQLISAHSLGILPTTEMEPFGLTSLEMQACGLPVIVTQIDGLQYTVRDRVTGFLSPPTAAGLRTTLFDAFSAGEDRLRAMGEKARRLMVAEYDWSIVAEKITATLLNL